MNWFLIPLPGNPISFQISLAGIAYILTVKWNDSPDSGWIMDLADAATNTPIVAGVPLITGANCTANLQYLGLGGLFIVNTTGDQTAVPTYTNLGTDCNLYFVTPSSS